MQAVGVEAELRPIILVPLFGLGMVGLAVARLTLGPGPGWPWLAVAVGATGAGIAVWGVNLLRRAKAARPGVSWWGLLRGQLAALVLAVALAPVVNVVPQGERDELMRTLREWFELVHVARGH
jgi:hypothetical protein